MMPENQTPSYGQIAQLPCGYLWQGKAKGVNTDRKSGAVPLRRLGGELHRLSGRRASWPWSAKKLRTCLLMQAQRKLGPICVMLCTTQPSSLLGIHRENTRIGSTATTRRLSPYGAEAGSLCKLA